MSQIHGRLWLCEEAAAQNPSFLRLTGATHVLNCAAECSTDAYPSPHLVVQQIPLEDDEDGGEPEEILEGAWTLHEWLDTFDTENTVVLVHCKAGISRSPSVLIAYFILFYGMGYEEAWDTVASRCGFIRPIPYWVGILKGLEVAREDILDAGRRCARPPLKEGQV